MQNPTEQSAPLSVRIYRADNRFDDGAFRAARNLAAEIWHHRAHVGLIFMRDFRAATVGTALGRLWNFILPVLPVSVYVFLAVLGVFPPVDDLPRGVFVAYNVTLWLLFSGLIEKPISVIKGLNNASMKTSLPLSVSVASSFASLCFETVLRIGLVAVLMAASGALPSWTAPLSLVVIVLGCAFSLSLGLVLAVVNIALPDTNNIVGVVLRYGIFVSGVIFPLSAIPQLQWMDYVNPLAILIHAARDLTFHAGVTYPLPLAIVCGLSLLLVLYAARTFYLMEYRIRGIV